MDEQEAARVRAHVRERLLAHLEIETPAEAEADIEWQHASAEVRRLSSNPAPAPRALSQGAAIERLRAAAEAVDEKVRHGRQNVRQDVATPAGRRAPSDRS
ncbi:MAG: hypothetical protein WKF56_01940 [Candidatus Limnocylindrales bacterium]